MTVWVRSNREKANKWHLQKRALAESLVRLTICGQRLPEERAEFSHNVDPPQDAFGVCLHCLRGQEKANRAVEAQRAA